MPFKFCSLRTKIQRRTARFVGLVGAVLLAAGGPAAAATYYVAPGGNDSGTGTSLATAWQTLSKANSTLQPGDVVLIRPGTYSGAISPARDGTASSRISYVGSLSSPGTIVVGSISLLGRNYISVKGVTSPGDVTLGSRWVSDGVSAAAEHDSLEYVVGTGSLHVDGAHFCHVGHCVIGDDTPGDNFSLAMAYWDTTRFCVIEDNVFNLASVSGVHPQRNDHARNCQVSRNVFNIRIPNTGGDESPAMNYRVLDCTFTDNKHIVKDDNYITASGVIKPVYGLNLRDESRFNSWVRDTFISHPNSTYPVKYVFSTDGSYNNGNKYNSWTNCFFKCDTLIGTYFDNVHLTTGYNFTGNTFVTKHGWSGGLDSSTFRHNTFISAAPGRVVDGGESGNCTTIYNSVFRGNIFYGHGTSGSVPVYYGAAGTGNTADSNLVYSVHPGGTASWTTWTAARPHSMYADPLFADTLWASFNPTPGNPATRGSYWPESYVGAIASGAPVGDVTPPGAVGDLALVLVSDQTIVLRWTATGDDGTTGQATAYDLRWSSQPITAANFASATPVGPQPVPAGAGTPESYALTNLSPSTNYYFALRVGDEAGNWSGLSNVLGTTTKATDTVPPAATTLGR